MQNPESGVKVQKEEKGCAEPDLTGGNLSSPGLCQWGPGTTKSDNSV
jgi:hypothetical protein